MNYRTADVYYYSGTGNSYRVAAWMAGASRDAGVSTTLQPVETASLDADADLVGVVFPTHGFTAPWAVLRFVWRMPRRKGAHAVVVATRAGLKIGSIFTPGLEGTAVYLVSLILILKGYRIRGAGGIDMPSAWIAFHPGLSDKSAVPIVARAEKKTSRAFGAVLQGERRLWGWLALFLGLLLLPISLAYLLIGRFFLARLFFASQRCTSCGICAESCPNGAIRMVGREPDQRPYWTFDCESCMRCMAFCPTRAVEANYLLAVAVIAGVWSLPITALLAWMLTRLPALMAMEGVLRSIVQWSLTLFLLGVLYPLFHLILGVRWINQLVRYLTATNYYRRYHEPETRVRDLRDSS